MTLDDLPFPHPGEAPPTPSETRARKCRHSYRLLRIDLSADASGPHLSTMTLGGCVRCGKPYEAAAMVELRV